MIDTVTARSLADIYTPEFEENTVYWKQDGPDGFDEIVKEWEESNMGNFEHFTPICAARRLGEPMIMFREIGRETPTPYSVQYRGNGHYFRTLRTALKYLYGRAGARRGKWIKVDKNWQRCSVCGVPNKVSAVRWCKASECSNFVFCPNCGAKMEGVEGYD